MKIVTITLETLWKNFMSVVADMMWNDASFASSDDIERVRSVILTGEEPVNTVELCRLFREAWTVTFLGDLMREVDTFPPTPVEIHVQDGDNTYVIPNLFVVY
jgi:hypothetical protein